MVAWGAIAELVTPDIGPDPEWYRERALADTEPLAIPCPCRRGIVATLAETLDCPGDWRQTGTGRWVYDGGCVS